MDAKLIFSGNMMVLSGKIIGAIESHALSSSLGEPRLENVTEEMDLENKTCILRRWLKHLEARFRDPMDEVATVIRSLADPFSHAEIPWDEVFPKWYKEMISSSELRSVIEAKASKDETLSQKDVEVLTKLIESDNPLLGAEGVLVTLERGKTLLELHRPIAQCLDFFTLFLTDTGYQGGAALGIKEGGQIALLAGCDYPMVIRRADPDCFELIAPAFVAGIMDGGAWSKDESDLEGMIFV